MAVINKDIAYMALPLSIRRGNPFPIDEYSVWYDKAQLDTYAQTSPVAYVGQVVVLVNEEASTVEAYMIQNAAGNLVKLAATTESGDLADDVIALQGKVSNIEATLGTKGAGSGITASTVWAAIEEVNTAYKAADAAISQNLTENYYNKTETDSQIDNKIATAVGATYKPAGSINFAFLPELSASEEGKVYNILDEFVTTENFVEGAGKKYPVGTNVVCIDSDDSGTYKWDVLAGFIDTSNLATVAQLNNKVDKVEGSSLIQTTLIDKLNSMANIKGVSDDELSIDQESGVLSIVAIDSSKVTGLSESLESKVDKVPGSSLVEDTLINKLRSLSEIKNVSSEFNLSDGTLSIKGIEQSKITGLTDALGGKISAIQIGDESVSVEGGIASIPIATTSSLGAVKSSEIENSVAIAGDGTMSVHSLNINKLTQGEEDVLILDGGASK